MIKNIVFDLGSVLINFEPLKYIEGLFSDKELADRIYREIFRSREWPELDRGTITEEEAVENICRRNPDISNEIRRAMSNWCSMLTPIEDTVSILKCLKDRGYKLYILSNYHMKSFKLCFKKYDFFKLFDGKIISYSVKCLKPERDIYEKLVEAYNLVPEETMFIDDTQANIDAAKEIGIRGIRFKSPKDLNNELQELGVI